MKKEKSQEKQGNHQSLKVKSYYNCNNFTTLLPPDDIVEKTTKNNRHHHHLVPLKNLP